MKKLFIALTIVFLSFFGICSAGSKKKHKKTITLSKHQETPIGQAKVNQEEYNKLKQQLMEHLKSIDENKITDEYISQYLKKIGSPTALKLLDDCFKLEKYTEDGLLLIEAGKYAEAINIFTSAIALNSDNPLFWDKRGTAYFCLNNFNQAINDYTKAISLFPQNGFYYLERAIAYMKIGNKTAVNNDVITAANLGDPDAQAILNSWGQTAKVTPTYYDNQDMAKSIAMSFTASGDGQYSKAFEQAIRQGMNNQ